MPGRDNWTWISLLFIPLHLRLTFYTPNYTPNTTVDHLPTMSEDELCEVIHKYDGLVVRSATKVTEKVLDAASNMQVVGRAGVGVDNVDIAAATKAGVMVMNTPDGNTVSTAQLALSLLTSLVRSVPAGNMSVKRDEWDRKTYSKGTELTGKTLGVIGCGRIGQCVAHTAQVIF